MFSHDLNNMLSYLLLRGFIKNMSFCLTVAVQWQFQCIIHNMVHLAKNKVLKKWTLANKYKEIITTDLHISN